jgi:dolichol kinase
MDRETKRQLVHLSGAFLPFYLLWIHRIWGGAHIALLTLLLSLVAGYLLSEAYRRGYRLPFVASLIDETERPDARSTRPGRGAIRFFLGSFLALLLYPERIEIVSAAILVLALGDSVSTLVGRPLGRHPLPYNPEKSWEGSVGGFLASLLGALFLVPSPLALLGAFAGMLVESLPLPIDDNVTIPAAAATAMVAASLL